MNWVASGFYIEDGTPVKYREGKSTRFLDGKESVTTPGKRTEEHFDTDKEKIIFFEEYGFKRDMFGDHPEVIVHSQQHYEDKKDRQYLRRRLSQAGTSSPRPWCLP